MMGTFEARDVTIEDVLRTHTVQVQRLRPGHWECVFSDHVGSPVTARMDDGWLCLDATLKGSHEAHAASSQRAPSTDRPSSLRAWGLLQRSTALPAGLKYAVVPNELLLHLRADIPVDRDIDRSRWIHEACKGFKTLFEKPHATTTLRASDDGVTDLDLPALCQAAGWPFTKRSAGEVVVDLEVPEGFYQASIEQLRDAVCLRVRLTDFGVIPDPCYRAVGLLLLLTSGAVQMVRAGAGRESERTVIWFEVVLPTPPHATELAHALSALSVACRLSAREAAVLQRDEEVARKYLGLWNAHDDTDLWETLGIDKKGQLQAPTRARKGERLWVQQQQQI